MYEHYYVFTKYVVEKYDESVADSGGGGGGGVAGIWFGALFSPGALFSLDYNINKYILLRLFSSRIQLVGRI